MVIAGRHAHGAEALLTRYAASEHMTLISAAHGLIEATSAVRRMMIRDLLSAAGGLRAVEWLGKLDLVLDATTPRLRHIWSLCDRMSAYDAAYAATAAASHAPLVTVDQRLLRACRGAGIPALHLDDVVTAS